MRRSKCETNAIWDGLFSIHLVRREHCQHASAECRQALLCPWFECPSSDQLDSVRQNHTGIRE